MDLFTQKAHLGHGDIHKTSEKNTATNIDWKDIKLII